MSSRPVLRLELAAMPDAEAVLIGALLESPAAVAALPSLGLEVGEFADPAARAAFGAVLTLAARGEAVDVSSVATVLRERGLLEVCTPSDLNMMASRAARLDTLPRHAAAIRKAHRATRTRALGVAIANAAGDAEAVAELVREVGELLADDAPNQATASPAFDSWPDGRVGAMFETVPEPRAWLCEQRLLAGRGQLLVGVGGSSKTRVLYHIGAGAVTGHLPWSWRFERTGSAALFLAEDVAADVHHALHLLGATLPPEQRELLVQNLRVYPLAGRHPLLLELSGQALRETPVFDWMMRQLDAMPKPLAFVGLDPALGLTEGDELNPAHQRRFGELVDRIAIETGACTVATAHAAKGINAAEELGSHSARGSGAVTDAVRGEFTLRGMTADEGRRYGITDIAERKRFVQLAATKGNHLPPEAFAPLWLARGSGGMLAEVQLEAEGPAVLGERELRALAILKDAAPGGDVAVRFWRDQCAAAGVIAAGSPAAQEKAMQRIRDGLRAAGLIVPGAVRLTWAPAP